MIRAVLFDLEGTLVDFQWNLAAGEEELRRTAVACGFLPWPGDDYAGIWNRVAATAPLCLRPSLQDRFGTVYDRWDGDALKRWSPRPQARQLLGFLRDEGVAAALVTNVGAKATARVLRRFRLDVFLSLVVTRNDVTFMKPRGEGVRQCLAGLGVREDDALFVGDSVTDVRAAREAGIEVAVVAGGQSAGEEVRAASPTYMLSSLGEVRELVQQLRMNERG